MSKAWHQFVERSGLLSARGLLGIGALGFSLGLIGCGNGGTADEAKLATAATEQSYAKATTAGVPVSPFVGQVLFEGQPASIGVTALTKVSELRITRTVFEYVMKVSLLNAGGDAKGISLSIGSAPEGTTIVDGNVFVGDLASGASATPDDTITIRQDRALNFDPGAFAWTLAAAEGAVAAAVDLIDYSFVENAGRPGHEGLFPSQSVPAKGTSAILRVRLIGPVKTASAQLVSMAGKVLVDTVLSRPGGNGTATVYYGTVTIPSERYRLMIAGRTDSGVVFRFDTANSAPREPVSLELKLRPTLGMVIPNAPLVVHAYVVNVGATEAFAVTITDNLGNLAQTSLANLTIPSQQSATLKISLLAPPTIDLGEYRLTVSLQGSTISAANSASLQLPISRDAGSMVVVDIKPGSCGNPIQPKSGGVTSVALMGSGSFNALRIDPASVRIAGDLQPIRMAMEDIGSPFDASCEHNVRDGIPDLVLHFDTSALAQSLQALVPELTAMELLVSVPVSVRSLDGVKYVGFDEVILLKK